MLIVSGWLAVDPDERTEYLAGCVEVVRSARAAPGCLDFTLAADLLDDARINVYERWESAERLAEFRGSGPPGDQQARIRDASVRRYTISAESDP